VADYLNSRIRKIAPGGIVTTIAGNDSIGSANGQSTLATFYFPNSVAVDAAGNVFVTDDINNLIREIAPNGTVSTLAGSGLQGAVNGAALSASFNDPAGVAVDASDNVYIADAYNNLIRKISPAGMVTTLAGQLPAMGVSHNASRLRAHIGMALRNKRLRPGEANITISLFKLNSAIPC
jgi:hypothetical protein